jgi:hypothetical protein
MCRLRDTSISEPQPLKERNEERILERREENGLREQTGRNPVACTFYIRPEALVLLTLMADMW